MTNTDSNSVGTTGHTLDNEAKYNIICERCHWEGNEHQLKAAYVRGRNEGVELEPCCPSCGSVSHLIYEEK
jgi:hypothetical protein